MAEKILLVDDEEGIRKVLAISLSDKGYQVFTAKSGEEALHIFKEQDPPIVLTDIKMPGMDGIELLQKMKQENPDTEVIMITGHGDGNRLEKGQGEDLFKGPDQRIYGKPGKTC
jgi:YesN/AraC family two-component response regulator